jgi:hypothetical protein
LEVVVVEVARDLSSRASERLRQLRVVAVLLLDALNATRSVWRK